MFSVLHVNFVFNVLHCLVLDFSVFEYIVLYWMLLSFYHISSKHSWEREIRDLEPKTL